jgi:hypothetical protein
LGSSGVEGLASTKVLLPVDAISTRRMRANLRADRRAPLVGHGSARQNDDAIGDARNVEPVCHDHGGAPAGSRAYRLEHHRLGRCVKTAGGLI